MQHRSEIIVGQLIEKRREKMMKQVFLRMLERVLQGKQVRLLEATVGEFRGRVLAKRAWKAMMKRWLRRKRGRLMK